MDGIYDHRSVKRSAELHRESVSSSYYPADSDSNIDLNNSIRNFCHHRHGMSQSSHETFHTAISKIHINNSGTIDTSQITNSHNTHITDNSSSNNINNSRHRTDSTTIHETTIHNNNGSTMLDKTIVEDYSSRTNENQTACWTNSAVHASQVGNNVVMGNTVLYQCNFILPCNTTHQPGVFETSNHHVGHSESEISRTQPGDPETHNRPPSIHNQSPIRNIDNTVGMGNRAGKRKRDWVRRWWRSTRKYLTAVGILRRQRGNTS